MGVFHVKMLPILFAIGVLSASVSSSFLPQWQELNCEANHKYLFADVTHTWQDAREECALYGGWLLSIDSMQEQNCLLKYAKTNVQSGWFWHDATDSETEGVYVHAKDNLDLTWINTRWRCDKVRSFNSADDFDYLFLGLYGENDVRTGAWCSYDDTQKYYFICEGLI